MFKKLWNAIFFGNYFYGACTVALSIEASLQQGYPLNGLGWYIFLFSASVMYYIQAYMGEVSVNNANERTLWYVHNRKWVKLNEIVFLIIIGITVAYILYNYGHNILQIRAWQWLVISSVPIVALLYYGMPGYKNFNIRKTGWLKPFIIGFVWSGCITVYPLIFSQVEGGRQYEITTLDILLFVKNLMFIAVLGIMFDIKDYASDSNRHLKTFVVRVGLRKTLFSIIIPLSLVGYGSFILFALLGHFPAVRIVLNSIPFVLLLIVGYSMHRRKSIMYYLVVIDGLMLVKAFCGILGMLLIK